MNADGIAALIFVVVLAVFLWRKRSQVQIQKALFPLLYVVMYRSSLGLKSMDSLAKRFPRFLNWVGIFGVWLGFIGMVLICFELIFNTFKLFTSDGALPGIQPVLPVEAKGVFFVPFLYWIISIFVLAVVHEFSHGVLARVHKIPVKSSGFAFLCVFLPVVPAAFVEPDEKSLTKRRYRDQLSVFAAGPVSNFLCALVVLGIFFALSPVVDASFDSRGVELLNLANDSPAYLGGLRDGDVITGLDGVEILSVENLTNSLKSSVPGDVVSVVTLNSSYNVTLTENPNDASKGFLGVQAKALVEPNAEFEQSYGAWLPPVIKWIAGLLFWLFMLNIGVGLFNLLPIGPLDGGRMFQLVCFKFFKKDTALKVWSSVSLFLVAVIFLNLFAGFIL